MIVRDRPVRSFSPEAQESFLRKICKYLEAGLSRNKACALVSLSPATLSGWIQENEDVYERVKKAEAVLEHKMLGVIQQKGLTIWQCAAWYLERHNPEEWALRTKTEFSGFIEGSESDVEKRQRLIKLRGYLNKIDLGEKKVEKAVA